MRERDIKLYVSTFCPFCQKPKNYILENDLDVEVIDITKSPEARDDVFNIGGKVQVPMLSIDGEGMYESLDILDWLKENM